jgi:hypothetical protein
MIKFTNERDGNYERVSQDIGNLLETTLPTPSEETLAERYPSPSASLLSLSSVEGGEDGHEAFHDEETDIVTQIPREIGRQNSSESTNQEKGLLKQFRKGLQRSFRKVTPASKKSTGNVPQRERRPSTVAHVISENSLSSLRRFNKVLILDDSQSMREPIEPGQNGRSMSRWESLVECVEDLCEVAEQGSGDSYDIHFLINRHKDTPGVRSRRQVSDLLASIDIESSGASPLDHVLWRVLNGYLEKYRNYIYEKGATGNPLNSPIRAPNQLNLIVITDGVSDDHEEVEATIIRTARVLPA